MKFDSNTDVISKHKPLFDRIANKNDIDKFVLSGGRSSFKSYDTCLAILIDMLVHAEKGKQANAIIFMQKREEIRDGVFKQFEAVIDNLDLRSLFSIKVSPFELKLNATGSVIKFYGLNKQQGKKANAIDNIAWLWFEEFDQFDSAESVGTTLATFLRHNIPGERIKQVFSFNPPRSPKHWVFSYTNNLNAKKIHTTYLDDDTGKDLITPQQLDEINELKERDYAWYKWEYLGEVLEDTAIDFPNLTHAKNDLELTGNDYIFIGVDSSTTGKDSTVACILAYNDKSKLIKFIGYEYLDNVWVDGYSSIEAGSHLVNLVRSVNAAAVYIDRGYGQHLIDAMIIQAPEIPCRAINFGGKDLIAKSSGRAELALNNRAVMYLNASDQLQSKRVVAYADCEELERQLGATEFEITSKEYKVISKDTIKARIGKSPDEADSFVLATQGIYDLIL
ncbi:hypothetical protein BG262_02800 [Floricoccus penangensis]|uniref:Phage terminase large subunit N-terminal domain-containing protein n=1 Tax=Floricoccus penangensis TaxID=1859475 RepID=A0A9Q5JGM8_9LACT|nr:PBSX family phage terminase large subunit [Floricoccus penangensis]OFI46744.1 hypothetical protein BG262_02800 [Floricoccus penangensis]